MADPPDPPASPPPDDAVTAGRGVLFIGCAKLYFMVAGYVIQFSLWPLLGQKAYGDYGVVKNLASWFNNVVVTGTIQAVSKFTSERPEQAEAVKHAAMRMQLFFGCVLGCLLLFGAPWFAALLRDARLVPYLRIASGIVLCYSYYAIFVGTANGLRHFHKQAGLDMTYSTLKAAMMLVGAGAGLQVVGALGGFLAAAATILVISVFVVGLRRAERTFPARRIARFMAPLLFYMLFLNLLLVVDQFLLKRLVTEAAMATGLPDAADLASRAAGSYEATQTLARIPYQAIIAAAFVVFPLVSRSTFEEDHAATRAYISQTLRYCLIFATMLAVVLSSKAHAALMVPFDRLSADTGAQALTVLALGQVCFSLLTIGGTILNGAGKTVASTALCGTTLALAVGLDYWAISTSGVGVEQVLLRAATAQSIALLVGFGLMGAWLRRAFGALLPGRTFVRVVIAGAVAWGVGRLLPEAADSGRLVASVVTLGECVVVLMAFLAGLTALREFTAEDRANVQKILRRRKR